MTLIKIGKIVNTHGIKGELRILSNFPYKDKVFINSMKIYISKNDIEEINTYRRHKNFDMITLKNYDNINDVLKYKGKYVYIDSNDIKLSENTYLDEDIIGLTVIINNSEKGVIYDVERYDKNTLLNIKNDNNHYLIPYHDNFIDKIDINNHKIYLKNTDNLL